MDTQLLRQIRGRDRWIADADADTLKLLAELEQELGVKGAAAVFRKALALAKAARADAEREFGPLSEW